MTDQRDPSLDDDDPAIARIAAALRPLPSVDAEARARVLIAVAAEREREATVRATRFSWRRLAVPAAIAAALLAVITLVPRGSSPPGGPSVAAVATPVTDGPASAVSLVADADAGATAARPVQLVLRAPSAQRVAVVGDFTGWDEGQVKMTRDSASGLWSATVLVRPGRHVYAFVVDDTLWMPDPRAAVATDPDFGRPGSLLLVGRP